MELTRAQSTLASVLRNTLYVAETQRLLERLCLTDRIKDATVAVASVLLSTEMSRGNIPQNTGDPSFRSDPSVLQSCIEVARQYHEAGGVLTAKGFVFKVDLALAMERQWLATFVELPATTGSRYADIGAEERALRLTVAAQACERSIHALAQHRVPGEPHWTSYIDAIELETLCKKMARAAVEAFDSPVEANHANTHGQDPKES